MTESLPVLTVNPKFKKLLRPLSSDERQRLEWSILKDGILDPIKVWLHEGQTFIVDGHNRHEIWQKFTAEVEGGFTILELKFESEDEALEWIIENQLRRRNLSQNERVLYLGRLFEMRKKRRGGLAKTDEGGATADVIAAEHDVSPRTVTRAAEIALAYSEADKEMQELFASGEISQADLLRAIKQKEEAKHAKKDKLHNTQTKALASVGERIGRTAKTLQHLIEDYREVCKALKLNPDQLLDHQTIAGWMDHAQIQADTLSTVVYVGGLCPREDGACPECGGDQYMTEAAFKDLRDHFGLGESHAKTAE